MAVIQVMIQEPPHYQVKRIPSDADPLGTIEHDTAHHPGWSKIYFHTNVSVYVNLNILKTHNFFLFPTFDNNAIAFTLQQIDNRERYHFINIYNNEDQPTLKRLLTFLEHKDLDNLTVLGDFYESLTLVKKTRSLSIWAFWDIFHSFIHSFIDS
jgi:hypothetical protein